MKILRFKQVVDFLDAVGAKSDCPSCGQPHLSVVCDRSGEQGLDAHVAVYLMTATDVEDNYSFSPKNHGVAYVKVQCSNCGYTQMHDARRIMMWVDGRLAEKK